MLALLKLKIPDLKKQYNINSSMIKDLLLPLPLCLRLCLKRKRVVEGQVFSGPQEVFMGGTRYLYES